MSYTRSGESYQIEPIAIDRILADTSNPLCVIANTIHPRSRVLDVGAGNGILAMLLQRLGKDVEIDGIEPSAEAAHLAGGFYHRMINRTLDAAVEEESDQHAGLCRGSYDYVVLADVIEHTIDPSTTLKLAKRFLASKAQLLVSVPNVSFAPIRAELMNGEWQYTDWGIIERTHLRFFTKKTLLEAIGKSELSASILHHLGRSPFEMEKKLQNYQVDPLSLLRMKRDPLALTYQFLAVCSDANQLQGENAERKETWLNIDSRRFMRRYFQLRRAEQPR
jgi:2-polyprenyl-3-methyl-5-hydroxy-6-metoxy-1,4-benzoquinol methylase